MPPPCDCEKPKEEVKEKEKDYCGFSCADVKMALDKMLFDICVFHGYNPETASSLMDELFVKMWTAKRLMDQDKKPLKREPAADLHEDLRHQQ